MATKKAAPAAKKTKSKFGENEFGIEPRDLNVAQRRELFLKAKAERMDDWRVLKDGEEEDLVPFNMLSLDWGLRLYGLPRKGAVIQLHGDEESYKSTTTYEIAKNYQKVYTLSRSA